MSNQLNLVTLADVSAYIDDAIAEAELGLSSHRRAASRIVGLGALIGTTSSGDPRATN